jgi:DnaJ-class molecular chaperone
LKAYLLLAKKYHPDVCENKKNPLEAEKKFKEIVNAYESLKEQQNKPKEEQNNNYSNYSS